MMNIKPLVVGAFEVNCYILEGSGAGAIVVDPGDDAEIILNYLAEKELRVTAFIQTHGHMDHISALAEIHSRHPAPVAIHADDLAWAFTDANQMPPYYPVPKRPQAEFIELQEGEFAVGNWKCGIIHTPGHTPGGVCIHFAAAGVLISGDTLFRRSVGRTDVPGGDAQTLTKSLKRLRKLPADTKVYPGHGGPTTIGYEIENNIFMRSPSK